MANLDPSIRNKAHYIIKKESAKVRQSDLINNKKALLDRIKSPTYFSQ